MPGSGSGWASIAVSVLALAGVIFGHVVSSRANRRTARNQESINVLDWAKAFEERTKTAEAKAEQAAQINAANERRVIQLEGKLSRAEEAAESLVEIVEWVAQIVEMAHDPADAGHRRLVRVINGGPPAFHRYRRTP